MFGRLEIVIVEKGTLKRMDVNDPATRKNAKKFQSNNDVDALSEAPGRVTRGFPSTPCSANVLSMNTDTFRIWRIWRGAHFRDDFPEKDPAFGKVNVVLRRQPDGAMAVRREPRPEMPAELQQVIEEMG